MCEDPLNGTDVGNGTVLLYKKDYFYVGDRMEFYCDLGYGIKGVNVDDGPEKTSITCQSNSTWSGDVPECEGIQPVCNLMRPHKSLLDIFSNMYLLLKYLL